VEPPAISIGVGARMLEYARIKIFTGVPCFEMESTAKLNTASCFVSASIPAIAG
jgi:hypothetical protein